MVWLVARDIGTEHELGSDSSFMVGWFLATSICSLPCRLSVAEDIVHPGVFTMAVDGCVIRVLLIHVACHGPAASAIGGFKNCASLLVIV